MRRRILKALGLAMTLATATAYAGGDNPDPKNFHQSILSQDLRPEPDYFRAHEWDVDLFGAYETPEKRGAIHTGGGGGVGIDYFFNRYFGIGVEGIAFDGGPTVDTVSQGALNFIARYPIESLHLAPYVFAGAGVGFMTGDRQVEGDAGVGLEWRVTRHWGIFADGRYQPCTDTNDIALARVGVRFAF